MMSRLLLWIAAQIITESFPVSSSSHIKFLEKIVSKNGVAYFLESLPSHFDELLHLPTLIIFALFFFSRWYPLVRHPLRYRKIIIPMIGRTVIATSVTVGWYSFFTFVPVKQFFPIEGGLLITACLLFSLRFTTSSYHAYTWQKALMIGAVQGLALLPGISRLGSTYVVARWLRLSPRHAIEASCAMYVPLLVAAVIRSSISFIKTPSSVQLLNVPVGIGMLLSSVIAYGGFWLVFRMSSQHRLWWFGYYMLLFAACFAVVNFLKGG